MHPTGRTSAITLACWLASAALALAQDKGSVPSVTPGFPNVAQTPGAILSGLNAPQQGRTAQIAYHNGILFTVPEVPSSQPGADFQVRTWDLSDPANPIELDTLGITPMAINAHGYLKSGEYLVLGPNWPPQAPWSFRATTPGTLERTIFPDLAGIGSRGSLFQPWFAGPTYWSYDAIGGDATLSLNGVQLAQWDHLGLTGVIGHPFILGDLLIFASDQSRTGVATYDISDPANPVLLDVLTTGGAGGYWPELWGGDGKLYLVFPYRTNGNGFRVVDLTDPSDLQFVADTPLPGDQAMYIQFQDEFAFIGSHKVDLRTFESVLDLDGANTVRPNDGGTGIDTSQFALPLGNLLITGGIGPNEGMAVWAHQAAPDTRGPSVGFHIPQAGRSNYPSGAPISLLIHETLESFTIVNGVSFIVRPLGGSAIAGRITYSFDDVLTFTPAGPLLADTTYEVVLPAGGIKDAAGNGMVGYSFTFSTGASVGGNAPPTADSLTASAYPAAPGASLTLTATATDPEGGTLEYRFDFGDGSPKTAWSTSATAAHSYAISRHYGAKVQVRDSAGSIATATTVVTVLNPPLGPAATASSTVACGDAGRRVWTVNPDNNSVTAVHADTLIKEFEAATCADPRNLARAASGEVWVTCHGDDRIQVLSANGAALATLDTGYGSAPHGIVMSPDGSAAYVTLFGSGQVERFDTASRLSTGLLALGPTPRALALTADGARLLVTRFISPRQHAEVWEIDTGAFALTRTLRLPKFGDVENRDTTASGRGVANYLAGIAIAADGQSAWVAATKVNTERGTFFANDLDQDNTVRNVIAQLDLTSGALVEAIDIDNSDSATSIAFSPLGDYLLVTLQGNNEVIVFDTFLTAAASGLGSFVTRLDAGLAPRGLCIDPVTNRLFTGNFMARSLTAFETDDLLRTGTKNVASSEISTVALERLTAQVLAGKQIFYNASDPRMSAEGYLSCATCHVDGGHDGRTWDFNGRGEGFRNTATLRGRSGTGHGNVHWSANFDEIQDFENDIRNAFGGSGLMSDPDFTATSAPLGPAKAGLSAALDNLAAYVTSLGEETLPRSPWRNADGTMSAQALAGRTLFEGLSCASCHAGTGFTDSTLGVATLHDVGTLRTTSGGRLGGPLLGIDTPTLLGNWNTAPYLHDGSAATLSDLFRLAGGEVIQAEAGTPANGASTVTQFVDLNNDDTVHNRGYVRLNGAGETLTLSAVDGGSGGAGAVEFRYSSSGSTPFTVTVNGTPHGVTLAALPNSPAWRHTYWNQQRIENIQFTAGTTNTLIFSTPSGFPNVSLDDVVITTAGELAQAQPHRQVLALAATDQAALIAYLRQLDGRPPEGVPSDLFSDGFESGDTGAWDSVVSP